MRVLILCSRFRAGNESPWLIDDLANALLAKGVDVWVVVASARVPRNRGFYKTKAGANVISVGVESVPNRRVGRVWAMLRSALRVRRTVKSLARSMTFDAVLFPTISLLFGRAAEKLPLETRRLHILWDFFPTHHSQVGSLPLPTRLLWPLQRLERWSMGKPDAVLTMSAAGAEFFRSYHPSISTKFVTLPPWSEDAPHRAALTPEGPLQVVFGGQLARGRGVDCLIEAASIADANGLAIELVIAGTGPEEGSLKRFAQRIGAKNVTFLGQLDRATYSEVIQQSHVGVAITQTEVTSPSFPSKIGDYARIGLPVLVATETHSDVGHIVESAGAGISAPSSGPNVLASALARFVELRSSGGLVVMGMNARRWFESSLSADRAAEVVIEQARQTER